MAALFDQAGFSEALEEVKEGTQILEAGPTRKQRLRRITIACLILNRMIGSGIFVTPTFVLQATGSAGTTLVFWAIGGIFGFCGLMVWLELGLSTPRHTVAGERVGVPRSGGEKNYLEYIYNRPAIRTTCMFGIAFLVLGNLTGNAYAIGIYVMAAAGHDNSPRGPVIGIAVASITLAIFVHMLTRRGGIWLNNAFAVFKVCLLVSIVVLGCLKATGHRLGGQPSNLDNYSSPFKSRNKESAVNYADSFVYIAYSFAGFEQPFYVLSEFRRPRKSFTRYTLSAMLLTAVLFVTVNAAYLFVVPIEEALHSNEGMAILFLGHVFNNEAARKSMAALIAVSIFGNIVVMTFTASRVKQEIAKEGILPWSLFWAKGRTTFAAHIAAWVRHNILHKPTKHDPEEDLDHQEQSPMGGLLLHWIASVVLIAATSMLTPPTAYKILVNLYAYVIVVLFGALVSGGLLFLKLSPRRHWARKTHFQRIPKVLGLLPAAIYFLICSFLLVVAFVPPTTKPPYPYYLVPCIGITAPLWGLVWWISLRLGLRAIHKKLEVTRLVYVVPDVDVPGQWIQKAELIDHSRPSTIEQRDFAMDNFKSQLLHAEYEVSE